MISVTSRSVDAIFIFFFQAEDGIRDYKVTGVQTCALPISWLERIIAALQSGELDGQAMQALVRMLTAEQLQPLQQALDNFDFERAQECAQQLQQQLPSIDGDRA